MTKIVFDKLTKLPTVMATARAKRADQTGVVDKKKEEAPKEKKKVDFFAKGNESMTPPTLYQDQDDWNVRVFSNKFPIMEDHEVIVHSPDSVVDLPDLPQEQVIRYLNAVLNRVEHFNQEDKDVFIFNNRGAKGGASINHPHSQMVASKGFPGIIEEKREAALSYFDEHSSCYWCDLVQDELERGKRVVCETQHFAILVPAASRWSYEMMLLPKRHMVNIGDIEEAEISDLAKILQAALKAYDKMFDYPDRNYWIYTQRYEPFHWHMSFLPRVKVFAGLELGAGIWVNDKATPEDAAYQLGQEIVGECNVDTSDATDKVASIT